MTAPLPRDTPEAPPLFRRCRDPRQIEAILREDYYDAPVCHFPRPLRRAAAWEFLAPSPDVCFLTAELGGQLAGFAFAHTQGPGLWKTFARRQMWRHPLALAWVALRMRVLPRLAGRRKAAPPAGGLTAKVRELGLPRIDRPFRWSPPGAGAGYLDLYVTRPPFRGLGLAPQLLGRLAEEMTGQGVTLLEAHVDATNYSSLRAFLKAGWEAFHTSDDQVYARYLPRTPAREGRKD